MVPPMRMVWLVGSPSFMVIVVSTFCSSPQMVNGVFSLSAVRSERR